MTEITGVHSVHRRQESALDALLDGIDASRVSVSRTAAKLFVRYYLKHKAGLKNYLDDQAQAVLVKRDRLRMRKKTFAQARELESCALDEWIRTLARSAVDTGQRTKKRGYHILRLELRSGTVYKITYNAADFLIIGFYTGDWFDRPPSKLRLAHRRRHYRS